MTGKSDDAFLIAFLGFCCFVLIVGYWIWEAKKQHQKNLLQENRMRRWMETFNTRATENIHMDCERPTIDENLSTV